jgi:hypothetical protein
MKKDTFRHILFWIVVFGFAIVLNSCSSRKKEVEKTEESYKVENTDSSEEGNKVESNTKLENQIKVDDKTKTVTATKKWIPIDPTKPSSKTDPDGKKTVFSNSSYEEETTTELKDKKTNKTENSLTSNKSETLVKKAAAKKKKGKKKTLDTDLDKSGLDFWSWLWVLWIIVIGFVLIYLNKRFKWVGRVASLFSK